MSEERAPYFSQKEAQNQESDADRRLIGQQTVTQQAHYVVRSDLSPTQLARATALEDVADLCTFQTPTEAVRTKVQLLVDKALVSFTYTTTTTEYATNSEKAPHAITKQRKFLGFNRNPIALTTEQVTALLAAKDQQDATESQPQTVPAEPTIRLTPAQKDALRSRVS